MKFFSWMQSKLINGKQGGKKPKTMSANHHMMQDHSKEEFSDWPNGLLAIGTFGNSGLNEDPKRFNIHEESLSCSQDYPQNISPEDVLELQKQLSQLLHSKVSAESGSAEEHDTPPSLPSDNFNSASSMEDDRGNNTHDVISVIPNRGKDNHVDQTKNAIGKKSLTFLLGKIFLFRNGSAPAPSLRDPIPDKSRIERILRAVLQKKIYPHNSSSKATAKKYLDTSTHTQTEEGEDDMTDMANEGSKWVKTDSEYIVLEI